MKCRNKKTQRCSSGQPGLQLAAEIGIMAVLFFYLRAFFLPPITTSVIQQFSHQREVAVCNGRLSSASLQQNIMQILMSVRPCDHKGVGGRGGGFRHKSSLQRHPSFKRQVGRGFTSTCDSNVKERGTRVSAEICDVIEDDVQL